MPIALLDFPTFGVRSLDDVGIFCFRTSGIVFVQKGFIKSDFASLIIRLPRQRPRNVMRPLEGPGGGGRSYIFGIGYESYKSL